MTQNNHLNQISQDLGKITSDNDVLLLLSNAIKYISDKLLDAEEKISSEDELKIQLLLEKLKKMKGAFQKYAEFFDKNKAQVQSFSQVTSEIQLGTQYGYFHSNAIEMTDFFSKFQKDVVDVLSYTQKFFCVNHMLEDDKNAFGTLLDMIEKSKTKSQKIITLRNELHQVEIFISRIEARFLQFDTLTKRFQEKLEALEKEVSHMFRLKTMSLFGDMPTGNVAFIFQDNLLLTLFLEDIFRKIPHSEYGFKDFMSALVSISGSKNIKMIQEKIFLSAGDYENILEIYKMYLALYELHFGLQKELQLLRNDITHVSSQKAFLEPIDTPEDEKKIKVFSSGESKFLHELKDIKLSSSHYLDGAKLEKREVGNPELLRMKKEIFLNIFSLLVELGELSAQEKLEFDDMLDTFSLDDLSDKKKLKKLKSGSLFEKKVFSFYEIFHKYAKYKKDKKELSHIGYSDDLDGKKSTYHYKPVLDSYGVIQSFAELRTDAVIAKTIGKTAQEIKNKIQALLDGDKWSHILGTFPGEQGSLEGNFIILGPWGGGKTALIKELSQNKDIATVEIGKSDIVDMYVGATEKNMKAIYELSYQIHLQTKKHVFVFIDEVDALLQKITTAGGGGIDVQKELQTMLDGVRSYPGVHTIMLSNKPHGISIDIYRRMEKTFILQDLDLSEKVELIESRLGRYPMDEYCREFLSSLHHYFPNIDVVISCGFENDFMEALLHENNIEMIQRLRQKDATFLLDIYIKKVLQIFNPEHANIVKNMYEVTPKILWQITEKVFKKFLSKFSEKELLRLEKAFSKMNDKNDAKKVLKEFSRFPHMITLDDFVQASSEVFSSASVKSEIAGNKQFYLHVDEMMRAVSSNIFDGIASTDTKKKVINLQIIT